MPDAALVALAEQLQARCLERGLTVGAAESCTGGLIAASITAVPGASGYFLGAIVSYADDIKAGLLDVPRATLEAHGAVSAQVARAMAEGCRARLGVALAVAVTGIAGPDGGTAAKPVGLTYVAMASDGDADVRRLQLTGDRDAVRHAAASEALGWLLEAAS
ncbi:MAG TPA: CinA family protein [Candidatus Limnocylindrales bacterium]|jgi:PncC family amidohydrolase